MRALFMEISGGSTRSVRQQGGALQLKNCGVLPPEVRELLGDLSGSEACSEARPVRPFRSVQFGPAPLYQSDLSSRAGIELVFRK